MGRNFQPGPLIGATALVGWAVGWFVWDGLKALARLDARYLGNHSQEQGRRAYQGCYVIPRGAGQGSTWYGRAHAR